MRDNSLILFVLIIVVLFTLFGGLAGIGFSGGLAENDLESDKAPGFFDIIGWCWDGLKFLFLLMAFQVEDVPMWQSLIFDIIALLLLWILLKWVRGTTQGV